MLLWLNTRISGIRRSNSIFILCIISWSINSTCFFFVSFNENNLSIIILIFIILTPFILLLTLLLVQCSVSRREYQFTNILLFENRMICLIKFLWRHLDDSLQLFKCFSLQDLRSLQFLDHVQFELLHLLDLLLLDLLNLLLLFDPLIVVLHEHLRLFIFKLCYMHGCSKLLLLN